MNKIDESRIACLTYLRVAEDALRKAKAAAAEAELDAVAPDMWGDIGSAIFTVEALEQDLFLATHQEAGTAPSPT